MSTEDLFYRPHIEPTRDYHSDTVILHEEPQNTIPISVKDNLTEMEKAYVRNVETAERLLRIRKITPLLPNNIIETINTILDIVVTGAWYDNERHIRAIIEMGGTTIIQTPEGETDEDGQGIQIKITFEDPKSEKESKDTATKGTYEIPTSGETDEDGDYEWPEMTSSGYELQVEENKNIWDLANEQYLADQSLIREAFSFEYNDIMEKYIYQLLTAMDEAEISDPEALNIEYEGETVSGIQENNQHLNDIIVRNQIKLKEYGDLFASTHGLYQTSGVLSSFDVIAQERIRYLKERYEESSAPNYLEMYDKNLLAGIRDQYESKYRIARANTYKFFHSAAALSADMLSLALDSNLAKCSLIKKGIDIFKKKEYQNEAVSNSTSVSANEKDEKKQDNRTKATDITKAENKEDQLDKLKIEDSYGGTNKISQDKTKEAASGTVKTTAEDDKVKVRVTVVAKNNKEKK